MPFYHLIIADTNLRIADGPIGFHANRYVRARDERQALERVTTRTKAEWREGRYSGVSETEPEIELEEIARVSFWTSFRNRRLNRSHIFFYVDD